MLSAKRFAQLGLGAACFVLLGSMAVLVRGAADLPTPGRAGVSPVPAVSAIGPSVARR